MSSKFGCFFRTCFDFLRVIYWFDPLFSETDGVTSSDAVRFRKGKKISGQKINELRLQSS